MYKIIYRSLQNDSLNYRRLITIDHYNSIAGTKGAMATNMWVDQGVLGTWDPKFLRPFNDWEMEAIQAFVDLTSNNSITPMVKDKMVWKGADSGCFKVKAYFRLLEGASPHSIPTKMLWNPYVPSKIGFFFCLGGLVGQGAYFFSTKEKRLSLGKQMSLLWKGGRRAGAHFDPLSFNWGQWTDLFLLLVLLGFAPSLLKIFFKSGCIFRLGKKIRLFGGQLP